MVIESLSSIRNYNLIVKNVDLFKKFHTTVLENLKHDQATKDLLKILIKIYEYVLKDISSHPQSQIHLTFPDQDHFQNDINAMMFTEEDNEKNTQVENDIKSTLFVFPVIEEALISICTDFVLSNNNSKNDVKSNKKVLGIKR